MTVATVIAGQVKPIRTTVILFDPVTGGYHYFTVTS